MSFDFGATDARLMTDTRLDELELAAEFEHAAIAEQSASVYAGDPADAYVAGV